jgi:hypothetical protein
MVRAASSLQTGALGIGGTGMSKRGRLDLPSRTRMRPLLDKMSLANPRSTKRLSGSGCGEHSKRRGPCPGAGYFREPGCNPYKVERSGQQ